jgi:RimJ/RimL family protein N-acetyltransferase
MMPGRAGELNAAIATDRLVLEPLTAAHADALFEALQDGAIYTWISLEPPASLALLRERWARLESRITPDGREGRLNWAVRRALDGAYVGKCDVVVDMDDVATNVGYLFFPPFWGSGYAGEALAAIVEHLARHGIVRLLATVTAGNTASMRVLERAGFVRTRVIPDNDVIRGVSYDDIEYVRDGGAARGESEFTIS